jgi:hypothetical protein
MITTVAQLREYLNQVPTGTSVDAQLTAILTRAESIVTDALGFTFFASNVTWSTVTATAKRVRSERSVYLKLPPYLVGSITSLVVMHGSTPGTAEISDYEETGSKFYLERPDGWGGHRYQVTAKWGYGPAPASIIELILELAVNIWRQKDQGLFQTAQGVDTVGNNVGGGYIRYVGGLNADQRRIVANVRRQYLDMSY